MWNTKPTDGNRGNAIPHQLMDGALQCVKLLLSLGLMLAILAGGLFLPVLWEEPIEGEATSRRPYLVEPISNIQINEDANTILLMTRHDVIVRDRHTGVLIQKLSPLPGKAAILVWVPHSRKILAGCDDGRLLMLDDFHASPDSGFAKPHQHPINSIEISPAGTLAATGSCDRICLWNLARKELLAQVPMQKVSPIRLRFSPDETQLAAGCGDGSVRLFQTADLRPIKNYQLSFDAVVGVEFIEHGQRIFAAHLLGDAFLIETSTDQVQRMNIDCCVNLLDVAVSPDQEFVAFTDWSKEIHVYSLKTHEKVASLKGHSNGISTLQFSQTEPWLYSGSYDGSVRIWDVRSFAEIDCYQGSLPWDED